MTTPEAAVAAPSAVAGVVAPAAVVPAAAPVADSLIPTEVTAAPAAPTATATLPPVVAPSLVDDGPEWLLYDGVKGTGKMPEWYKADKYTTVAAQAEAYSHLEKRFGAFVGAPKDGKYAVPPLPEGLEGEFLTDHPMFAEASKWAAEKQFSQEAYNEMMGMLAQYEASQAPDFNAAKVEIGEKADERINSVSLWAKANLDTETFGAFRAAMGDRNAATVFKAIEAIIAKTRQPVIPKPGDMPGDGPVSPLAEINELQAKVDPKTGKRLFETDTKFRDMVEKKRFAYFKAQEAA